MLLASHWPYIYILLFIIFSFLIEIMLGQNRTVKNTLYILNVAILCFFSYYKDVGVGADDSNYVWYLTGPDSAREHLELFSYFIFSSFHYLGYGLSEFNLFCTFLFCVGAWRLSSAFNISLLFWLIVYISFGNFFELNISHIRNCLSLAVVMLGIPYLKRKKDLHYLAFILTASMIHFSSFIFVLCVLIKRINVSIKVLSAILLLSIPLTFISIYGGLYTFITSLDIWFLNPMIIALQQKQIGSEYAVGFSWSLFSVQRYMFAFVFLILFKDNLNDLHVKLVICSYILGILLWSMFHEIYIFSSRFMRSMSIFEPILMWLIIKEFKKDYYWLLAVLVLFLLGNRFIEYRVGSYFLDY